MEILEPSEDGAFLFLDAHWHDYWPVHDELSVLRTIKIQASMKSSNYWTTTTTWGGSVTYTYNK